MRLSRHIIAKIVGALGALFAAVFCAVVIYDWRAPWHVASQSLERFGRYYHFCIGMNSESSSTMTGGKSTFTSSRQRAFIVMRAPIAWPRLVAMPQDQAGRAAVDERILGFWLWLMVAGGTTLGAWRFGFRLFYKKSQTQTAKP